LLQQGALAPLIGSATISGEDQSTGVVILNKVSGISTDLPDDKSNSGGGMVQ